MKKSRHTRLAGTFVLALMVLILPATTATAQEPGEVVDFDFFPLGSLKTIPTTRELMDLLNDPFSLPVRRDSFLNEPLPDLLVHPVDVDPLNPPFIAEEVPDGPLETPPNETDHLKDDGRTAAIQLGKALFWDMQVGSDIVQACGTCHFQSGVDPRTRNQLNPGTNADPPDHTLQVTGPNMEVTPGHFPFHKLHNPNKPGEPLLNPGNVERDANDVMSSMGVIFAEFVDIPSPGPGAFGPEFFCATCGPGEGVASLLPDIRGNETDPIPVFQGVRRIEPRNTPTMHAAGFNFDNFWDGRARHDYNGGSVAGPSDPFAHVFVDDGDEVLEATRPITRFSSLASQAMDPPISEFEMSFKGRFWAKIGKKLLQDNVVPLANQLVATDDSVLGPLSNQHIRPGMPGLNTTYRELIQAAFKETFWSNTTQHLEPDSALNATDPNDAVVLKIVPGPADPTHTNQFTQMEANFSFFFGIAVQVFEEILIPDDTPFDQFMDANPLQFGGTGTIKDLDPSTPGVQVVGLTPRQLFGLDLFQGTNHSLQNTEFKTMRCALCHVGPELTDHSVTQSHAFILGDPFPIPSPIPGDVEGLVGRPKVISGFLLEEETGAEDGEGAQDAVELEVLSMDIITGDPTGIALLDNGVYNIGVRPINEDLGRGANDRFGFPLSLAVLALRNAVSQDYPKNYPPDVLSTEVPPVEPLPDYLAEWANGLPVGEVPPFVDIEVFAPDTVNSPPMPALVEERSLGTWPNPNRVGRMGNFKAPQLRNVELTGPYFHNGGTLTLRQVIDFYGRGGDFPETNKLHRDPHIISLNDTTSDSGRLTEKEKDALVDLMLAFTDERVRYERAPFDRPETFVPIDGAAPDNHGGRAALLADPRYAQITAVGAGGKALPSGNFLEISSTKGDPGPDHFDACTFDGPTGSVLPVAVDDARTVGSQRRSINVLVNDHDPDGSLGSIDTLQIVKRPSNGTVAVVPDGVIYVPNLSFVGEDTFTYTIMDNECLTSNEATVTVTVLAQLPQSVCINDDIQQLIDDPMTPDEALKNLGKALAKADEACAATQFVSSIRLLQKAVAFLTKAAKKGANTDSIVEDSLNIVESATSIRIEEAVQDVGSNHNKVKEAQNRFAKALAHANPKRAIALFRRAFLRATQAMSSI